MFSLDSAGASPDSYERAFERILCIVLSSSSLCQILAPKPVQ
jgi:hypothetical protein